MNVYLNDIHGTADMITTMFFSKRTWTRELEEHIRQVVRRCTDRNEFVHDETYIVENLYEDDHNEFSDWMDKVTKWGRSHITMLRFIDFSITVEGLHRAGQDDWDAHAQRYNNRIIRSSTRLGEFKGDEISEWYKDKIIPMDVALRDVLIDLKVPEFITKDGIQYVRSNNGYIRKDLKDDKDVKRGLYMECIPSNFIFKVNLTEWAHVYKERNKSGHANPEVKELCERIANLLFIANPWFTRDLFMEIKN